MKGTSRLIFMFAALMPNAKAIDIPDRDHMLAVGDRVFKQGVLDFLSSNA